MNESEILMERVFSYVNEGFCINEKYNSIVCSKASNTITSQTKKMSIDEYCCLVNIDAFPNNTALSDLKELLIELDTNARRDGYSFSFFLTCKVIKRNIGYEKTNYVVESTFRIILCKEYATLSVEDIVYTNDIEIFRNNIIKECEAMLNSIFSNTEKLTEFALPSHIIFAPKAAAFFFHEIIGHLLEYDAVTSENAVYNERDIGKKYFNVNININENPFMLEQLGIDIGRTDDDGMQLFPIKLIKNGRLSGFIKSKRYDNITNISQTRMYCLCVEGDKQGVPLERIIDNTGNAIVVREIIGGWVNASLGEFSLFCGLAHYVVDGNVCGQIDNLHIVDNVHKITRKISFVGSDTAYFLGHCFKNGQTVLVGQGSPTIVLKNVNVK